MIEARTPEEHDADVTETASDLAMWEKSCGDGIRWLEQLTWEGKAIKLSSTGFPNRYTARASDVLLLLDQVRPTRPHLQDALTIHADRCAACRPDQVFTIDAWDLL